MSGQQRNRGIGIISDRKFRWVLQAIANTCLTDSEFAAALTKKDGTPLGTNQRTIKRFKKNKNVDKPIFAAIARLLEADVAWLIAPDPVKRLPRANPKNFCGKEREAIKEQLQEALRQSDSTVYCLTGRSGIGKTTQVLRLAYEDVKQDNPYFSGGYCFIQVGGTSIAQELEYFFQLLKEDISIFSEPLHTVIDDKRIQEWYSQIYDFDIKVLLIFDKVSSFSEIRDFLPPDTHRNIRVLITSTNLNLSDRFKKIKLKDFSKADAETYLQKILDKDEAFFQRYQSELEQICRNVGYLPFALSVVGNYIKRHHGIVPGVIEEVLTQLKQDSGLAKVLCQLPEDSEYLFDDLPDDLRTNLQDEGLRAILGLVWRSYSPEVYRVAYGLAFLAPAEIDYSLIRDSIPDLDEGSIKNILSGTLVAHSLVDMSEDEDEVYVLHDLTRMYLRESFVSGSLIAKLARGTVISLAKQLDEQQTLLGNPKVNRLFSHLQYFLKESSSNSEIYHAATEFNIEFFNYLLRSFYFTNGLIDKAEQVDVFSDKRLAEDAYALMEQLGRAKVLYERYRITNNAGLLNTALTLTLQVIERLESKNIKVAKVRRSASNEKKAVSSLMEAYCMKVSLCIAKANISETRNAFREAEKYFVFYQKCQDRKNRSSYIRCELYKAELRHLKAKVLHLEAQDVKAVKLMLIARKDFIQILRSVDGQDFEVLYRNKIVGHLADLTTRIIIVYIKLEKMKKIDLFLDKYENLLEQFDFKLSLKAGYHYWSIARSFGNKGLFIHAEEYLRKVVFILENASSVPSEVMSVAQQDLKMVREIIAQGKKITSR